jgi:hypothetical protein
MANLDDVLIFVKVAPNLTAVYRVRVSYTAESDSPCNEHGSTFLRSRYRPFSQACIVPSGKFTLRWSSGDGASSGRGWTHAPAVSTLNGLDKPGQLHSTCACRVPTWFIARLRQHHAGVHVLAHIKKLDDCVGKFGVRVESARHAGGPLCWLRSRLRRSRHGCGVDVELRAVHRVSRSRSVTPRLRPSA